MKRVLLLCILAAGCSSETAKKDDAPKPVPIEQKPVRTREMDQAIEDGVKFLLSTQRPGGYWGTGTVNHGWEIMAMVPGSLQAFKVATTGLCAMALREVGTPETLEAARKAELWIATEGTALRRADAEEIYNVWGHIYGLQALSVAIKAEKDPERIATLKKGASLHIQMLEKYETFYGGWNYYDFAAHTRQPSLDPTAFTTSAGLVALLEAKDAGLAVPEHLVKGCIRIVEKCRTPNNTYFYSYDWRWAPVGKINRMQGSLGRTQAGNCALMAWKSPAVKLGDVRDGLTHLVKDQKWLECGRKRPIPHEAYYLVAGYFYYFGHYYASRLLSLLPADEAAKFGEQLAAIIRPHQEEDGSWWDFCMWDFHKPYGTAYALMILHRCRAAMSVR